MQRSLTILVLFLVPMAVMAAAIGPDIPPGGVNAPPPSEPWDLVGETVDLPLGVGAVRIPSGRFIAPASGVVAYAVPGPIISAKGPDAVWRGQGYLETWSRLIGFEATHSTADGSWQAEITYRFEGDVSYAVSLQADVASGRILLNETSGLGVRDRWVFDCYYRWQPTAAIAVDQGATRHSGLFLPCHYDKPEVTISTAALTAADAHAPAGVAVVSPRADQPLVVGIVAREPAAWTNGDRLGMQLWQRRQLAGKPASRHFLGPETKSDGTPNPHTANRIGTSRYEGHVTIEMAIGAGSRQLAFVLLAKPEGDQALFTAVKEALR